MDICFFSGDLSKWNRGPYISLFGCFKHIYFWRIKGEYPLVVMFGCGSKLNDRRGKPQVLVRVSTYEGSDFHFGISRDFEPQPNVMQLFCPWYVDPLLKKEVTRFFKKYQPEKARVFGDFSKLASV